MSAEMGIYLKYNKNDVLTNEVLVEVTLCGEYGFVKVALKFA